VSLVETEQTVLDRLVQFYPKASGNELTIRFGDNVEIVSIRQLDEAGAGRDLEHATLRVTVAAPLLVEGCNYRIEGTGNERLDGTVHEVGAELLYHSPGCVRLVKWLDIPGCLSEPLEGKGQLVALFFTNDDIEHLFDKRRIEPEPLF